MAQADKQSARELELACENYGPSTSRTIADQRSAIRAGMIKKMKKGTYSASAAPKGWMHLVNACAKQYAKEHSHPSDWNHIFNAPTRRLVAEAYADEFESEYKYI